MWTELPVEFTEKIRQIFSDQFKIESNHGDFIVEGRIYPEEIVIRLGYLERGRLKQINFEASMDIPKRAPEAEEAEPVLDADEQLSTKKSGTMDLIYTGIDVLGSVMEEYFEIDDEDELDVPDRWKEFTFEGSQVYLQYSTVNTRLEDEANRLLGILTDELVVEEGETEDALAKAEVDSDLAFEVQKIIREGRFPHPMGSEPEGEGPATN